MKLVIKQKVLQKKYIVASKMDTRSSSRLKLVPEKIKNNLLSKMKNTLAVRKLMKFLFQENFRKK